MHTHTIKDDDVTGTLTVKEFADVLSLYKVGVQFIRDETFWTCIVFTLGETKPLFMTTNSSLTVCAEMAVINLKKLSN